MNWLGDVQHKIRFQYFLQETNVYDLIMIIIMPIFWLKYQLNCEF